MPSSLPTIFKRTGDDMSDANSQKKPRTPGEVRIRSNVCISPNAWNLVPGDLVKNCSLSQRDLTQKQKDEMMYYVRCCICHRFIFQILEDGCDYSVCREQGTQSTADAQRRKRRFLDNLEYTEG
jgi:hypothetical protein